MNIVGTKVKHISFGEGEIVAFDEEYKRVTIKFADTEKVLGYPVCFEKHLEIYDAAIRAEVLDRIEREKQIKLQEQEAEEIRRQERIKTQEVERASKTARPYPRKNIAFKCTYCDGGKSDSCIGFNGLCSDEQKNRNVFIEKRTWCYAEENPCRMYLEGKITKTQLEEKYQQDTSSICYESNIFKAWNYSAGYVVNGKNKGKPNTILGGQTNSLCVLTTQKIKSKKMERYIFGVFIVIRAEEGDEVSAGKVTAHPKYRVALSETESSKMCFWDYHKNQSETAPYQWGRKLFHYIDDTAALKILKDLKAIKQNTADEELVNEMIDYYCNVNNLKI